MKKLFPCFGLISTASIITFGSFLCGIMAILYKLMGYGRFFMLLMLCAAILDMFDGKVARWLHQSSKVGEILDALLQKRVTVDFLTKKMKPNEGEAPQHYVTGSHPAIVTAEVFELAQNEMKRRQESGRRICSDSIFASKILCGDCGGIYGSKVWNSNSKYRRVIWQRNHKYGRKGKSEANMCSTPHLTEDQIKKGFMAMVNEMLTSKNEIIAFYKDMLGRLTDTERIKTEIGENERQLASLNDQLRAWIDENARRAMDQAMYNQRYDELAGQATDLTQRIGTLKDKLLEMRVKREKANAVLNMIERQGLESVVAFDESLFGAIVDTITVHVGKLVFQLKDGTERETKL